MRGHALTLMVVRGISVGDTRTNIVIAGMGRTVLSHPMKCRHMK